MLKEAPSSLKSKRTLSLTYEIPIAKTVQFWEALKEGRFLTTRCEKCGHITFPPQADCSKCMASVPKWIDLGNEGVLQSFTQIVVTPVSFVEHDPYVVAVARFPHDINVLAWLRGVEPEQVKIGMRVRLVAKEADGKGVYEFMPA